MPCTPGWIFGGWRGKPFRVAGYAGAVLGDFGCIFGGSWGDLEGMPGAFWVGLELIMGRRLAAGKRAKKIAC